MARSDKRYSVYPSPKAIQVLGAPSPCLNQAIECWAAVIARATADNNKKFFQAYSCDVLPVAEEYPIDDWCILAEALKGKPFDPEFANPAEILATAVEDAQRFENISDKWFQSEIDQDYVQRRDASIEGLAKKLRQLDYAHAWAIIISVQWYWEHSKEVDMEKDQWWTLGFRREKEDGQIVRSTELQIGKSKKKTKVNRD